MEETMTQEIESQTPTAEELAEQIISANAARAEVYRVLSALWFTEIKRAQIETLHNLDFGIFADLDNEFAEGLNDMLRSVRKINSGTEDELAVDFSHSVLGAGVYEQRRATPFESVFTSKTGLLVQEARDDVYRMFCEEHLEAKEDLHIPEDHLSFITEFMAILCDRTNSALQESNYTEAGRLLAVQRELYDNHLANWVDDLCDIMKHVALTRFYRGVSKITRAFVRMDNEFLSDCSAAFNELDSSVRSS